MKKINSNVELDFIIFIKPRQVAGFFVSRHLGLAGCNIGIIV